MDRLDNLKRNVVDTGGNQCVLCGTAFGILGAKINICHDCRKVRILSRFFFFLFIFTNWGRLFFLQTMCSKCCIETTSAQKEQIWLCKICSETREMWKKSGAWFFKVRPNGFIAVLVNTRQFNNDNKLISLGDQKEIVRLGTAQSRPSGAVFESCDFFWYL